MDALNWLLINAGDAALAAWAALKSACAAVFGALDAVLNPVLSPVLGFLNPVFTVIGDGVYAVLAPLPVWLGLTLLSAICGVLMMVAFRYTSNQTAIGRARDKMTANLLALKLFKDDLGVAFRCQRRLFGALLYWQWLMLKPIFILIVLLLPGVRTDGPALPVAATAARRADLHPAAPERGGRHRRRTSGLKPPPG